MVFVYMLLQDLAIIGVEATHVVLIIFAFINFPSLSVGFFPIISYAAFPRHLHVLSCHPCCSQC